jgi:hypothetical protein
VKITFTLTNFPPAFLYRCYPWFYNKKIHYQVNDNGFFIDLGY